MNVGHAPVMVAEALEALQPRDGGFYVDGTFGGGGHASAILEAANCSVLGIDRDPDAIARGQRLVARFKDRLALVPGRYSEMASLVARQQKAGSDGVLIDLGVSSFQLDEPNRGFSFRADGPLDMRMERTGRTAAEVINTVDERFLADLLARFGEERQARRIARAIVHARPLAKTGELAEVVAKALGPAASHGPLHPATRTFQALRIFVNEELGELEKGLLAAERILRPTGRLVVIAFHSLEDRIVKRFFTERGNIVPSGSRHSPGRTKTRAPTFRLLTRRPRRPSAAEITANPRARSARLRAAERNANPIAA